MTGLAIIAVGLLVLARGQGSKTATGKVVSITSVATGKVVCVRDNDSGKTGCGETSDLHSVTLSGCAYIKVERDAALSLERRTCR